MHRRRLGNSDLLVSAISLGSWLTYGVSVDREESRACIERAFDNGINFFDTANMYGRGAAETLLGELLGGHRRESYILGTKVYYPMSNADRGLSRQQIRKQIDASLARLKTDYVDLYQCHRYDYDTTLEETMDAMREVVRQGKARYVGFSEWSPRRIRNAHEIAGDIQFVSSQPQYSMLYRKPEREVFPLCDEFGIGQIVWSPLAQGVLTGKYRENVAPPDGSRGAERKSKSGRFSKPKVLTAVQRLRPVAKSLSLTLPQLALAWVLRNQSVSSAITGASRPEQIDENAKAASVELGDVTLQAIDDALSDVIRR